MNNGLLHQRFRFRIAGFGCTLSRGNLGIPLLKERVELIVHAYNIEAQECQNAEDRQPDESHLQVKTHKEVSGYPYDKNDKPNDQADKGQRPE